MATTGFPMATEVPNENWSFEYDSTGMLTTRITVKLQEDQNGVWVRQYDKDPETSAYYCVGCIIKKRIKNFGQLIGDSFYAPSFHDCSKIRVRPIDDNEEELPLETMNQQIPNNHEGMNLRHSDNPNGHGIQQINLDDDIDIIDD